MESLIPAARELVLVFREVAEGRREADEFSRLAREFHNADKDPKKVLKEKDKVLINTIASYKAVLQRAVKAGKISELEFYLLILIVLILEQIEHILWELKQQTDVVPRDEPEPNPEPEPQPQPGGCA